MRIAASEEGSVEALAGCLAELARQGAQGAVVLACAANGWADGAVRATLRETSLTCVGGLFPGVLYEGKVLRRGLVTLGLREAPSTHYWRPGDAAPAALDARGLLVFNDASTPTEQLLEHLYALVGAGVACIGGGCGDLLNAPSAPVLTPEGLAGGGMLVASLRRPMRVAAGHGWSAVGEELCVTRAVGNVVHELNWQPALAVYRRTLSDLGVSGLDDRDLMRVATRSPLLLHDISGAIVVRDPLEALPDGSIRFAGTVDPHVLVRVSRGDALSMYTAAAAAASELARRFDPTIDALLTLCGVSRESLLGPRIKLELTALRLDGAAQVGALTIGEVVGTGESLMRMHNKCVALAAWREDGPP